MNIESKYKVIQNDNSTEVIDVETNKIVTSIPIKCENISNIEELGIFISDRIIEKDVIQYNRLLFATAYGYLCIDVEDIRNATVSNCGELITFDKYKIVNNMYSLNGKKEFDLGFYTKNKIFIRKLNKYLEFKLEDILDAIVKNSTVKLYKLIDENNVMYISKVPGALGGHKKLKIYGKLDCPSALNYIAKGQYTNYRVFFLTENDAKKAGYRPCGVCMKDEYKIWKQSKN